MCTYMHICMYMYLYNAFVCTHTCANYMNWCTHIRMHSLISPFGNSHIVEVSNLPNCVWDMYSNAFNHTAYVEKSHSVELSNLPIGVWHWSRAVRWGWSLSCFLCCHLAVTPSRFEGLGMEKCHGSHCKTSVNNVMGAMAKRRPSQKDTLETCHGTHGKKGLDALVSLSGLHGVS